MYKTCATLAVLACLTLDASALSISRTFKQLALQQIVRKSYIDPHWTGAATNIQDSFTNITDGGLFNTFVGGSVVGSGNSSTELIVTGSNNSIGAVTVTNSENSTVKIYV